MTAGELTIASNANNYGYRNKMEYSFAEKDDGTISLAFYKRGRHIKVPITSSLLADPVINETAMTILEWIKSNKIPIRSLKALIIRSNAKGETLSGLFIKDELSFDLFPVLPTFSVGFSLYYSTHKSPASIPTRLLYQDGKNSIRETVGKTELSYGLFSFFQVNIPVFEKALSDIASHVPPAYTCIDYYSGVGTIGLPLAASVPEMTLIESSPEAVSFARSNSFHNQAHNIKVFEVKSEDLLTPINADTTVIVDPPRAGLHKKVTQHLIKVTPPRIIYLSCNVSTQARDVSELLDTYDIVFNRLYNFFPRTPHFESLIVLQRKSHV